MGLFRCFSSHGVQKELPDDIIIEILSWLPAECVLKFRRVCKRWLAVTSRHDFAQMHLKRSKPVLFVHSFEPNPYVAIRRKFVMFQLEKKRRMWKRKKMRGDFIIGSVGEQYRMELKASCDGFLVFQGYGCPSKLLVCNIVTRERLQIDDAPVIAVNNPWGQFSSVHAMFLHPVSREYMMLVQNPSEGTWPEYSRYDFHLYSFTSKSWRQISSFHHIPEYFRPPVLHNNMLHWFTSSRLSDSYDAPCDSMIITFDTITEKFRVMPHPGDTCSSYGGFGYQYHHRDMFFYKDDEEGTLCLCWDKQTHNPKVIEIWVLEDYDKWVRAKKKYVAPPLLQRRCLDPIVMFEQELVYGTSGTPELEMYTSRLHDKKKKYQQELSIIFENMSTRKKIQYGNFAVQTDTLVVLPWTKSFVSLNAAPIQGELAT